MAAAKKALEEVALVAGSGHITNLKQSIFSFDIYGCSHRYQKNIDCLSFVVYQLLASHLPRHFPFFAAAINSTNKLNKAGGTRH
jgi:hypothetical protein